MYGILNTKTKYIFLKRDPDIASGRVYISKTFDGEKKPVGPILVWIAAMAADQAPLPRGDNLPTPLEKRWVTTRAPDSDSDGEGDVGSGPGPSSPPQDADGGSSRARAGPSSNTRQASKRACRSTAGGSSKKQRVLPHIEHELLEIGRTCYHGHRFLLREGKCCGQDALFKVFDFFKRPEALATLEEEAGIYERMTTIQGAYVPRILQVGLSYGGGMGFMAMSAEGPSLTGGCSPLEHDQAKKALQQVHACGVLHGDVNASKIIRAIPRADGFTRQNGILVVDFVESIYLPCLRWEAKAEEVMLLDQALSPSQD
ncbi:hypothetical protein WJX74_008255 [Apatococcus lobatus]